jgi:hypothetical protein
LSRSRRLRRNGRNSQVPPGADTRHQRQPARRRRPARHCTPQPPANRTPVQPPCMPVLGPRPHRRSGSARIRPAADTREPSQGQEDQPE